MDFAFLKQRYDYELECEEKLTNAVNQPVGFLTLVGGLLAMMVRDFSYADAGMTRVFLSVLALDIGVAAVSMWYLAGVYCHRGYRHLPHLGELVKMHEESLRFRLLGGVKDGVAADEFQVTLRKLVIEVSDQNTALNRTRESALRYASRGLILVLMLTSVVGASYVVDQTRSSGMAKQRIVLTDPPEVPEKPMKFPPPVIVGRRFWPSRMPPGFSWRPPWWLRLLVGDPPTHTWEDEVEGRVVITEDGKAIWKGERDRS